MFTRSISTEIEIAASPQRVWEILTEFSRYQEWNPLLEEGAGEPVRGATLELRFRPAVPGGRSMTMKPLVLTAEKNRVLRWRGRLLMPGIFTGVHEFLLAPSDTGTRLRQGERFSGVLIPLSGKIIANTRTQFEEMNTALKRRAESSVT